MFNGYFSPNDLRTMADAILPALNNYGAPLRAVLVGAIPASVSGAMAEGLPPAYQVMSDLQYLNYIERLTDGTVPLVAYLRGALGLGGHNAAMNTVRSKLSELESLTTGGPRLRVKELPETRERIVGRDDMVPYAFLERGLAVSKAVAKLEVPRFNEGAPHLTNGEHTRYLGTGWMIGPGLLITNHHVLNARNDGEAEAGTADLKLQTEATVARFDYDVAEVEGVRVPLKGLVCCDVGLDYAIARVDIARPQLKIAAKPIAVISQDTYVAVNIVQHPNGNPKRFAIRNNLVTAATDRDLRYFTDTDGGSSGSPVFDDQWEVAALHRGSTFAQDVQYQGRPTAYVNLGTQIHAILAHVRANAPAVADELKL